MLWNESSALIYGFRQDLALFTCLSKLTLCLKASRSSVVSESDFAMTGTTFTTSESFLRTTISIGLRLNSMLIHRFPLPLILQLIEIQTYE